MCVLFISAHAELYNTNLLIQRGVDPQVLNLSVTTFRQSVAYRAETHYVEHFGAKEKREVFNIIYNPYSPYGIDIRLDIPKNSLHRVSRSDLQYRLDEIMGLQSYLQSRALYDEKSFHLESEANGMSVISFRFNMQAIPRELVHYRYLKGYVYISKNGLEKIVVKNVDSFKRNGVEIKGYEKNIHFVKLPKGRGYLIDSLVLKMSGIKNKQLYESELTATALQYWNKDQVAIFRNEKAINNNFATRHDYKTVYVELDRLLPFYGKEVRKAGYDLPKPYGISLINMVQNTTMHMTSFKVDNVDIDFNKVLDGDSTYENNTFAPLIRADVWVLPFLNVGLLLGATNTVTEVTLHSKSGLSIGPLDIIQPDSKLRLDTFKTNSLLYGVGATLAGGIDRFFTTIDFQYVRSYTESADVSMETFIVTPLLGYDIKSVATRVFAGAQYQDLKDSLTFDVTSKGISASGRIGLYAYSWAGLVGANYDFTRHWSSNLMLSYGKDIKNMVLTIGYRW